ncbi:Hypothetical predicted protein [Paramuricea clavata]|uniref:Uncharacterized protein n=1 Tax=Paramuricea clavata TaxID=317549 RepID=A0A7D9JQ58_PARCT|nr:Hypothetical predicted protein [Paramuricea clavata]
MTDESSDRSVHNVKTESIELGESLRKPCSSTSGTYSRLDDSEYSDDQSCDIKFLEMYPLLPIYEQGLKKGLEGKRVAEILLQPNEDAVGRAVTTSVSINTVFVLDISSPHVMHYKNILADDLGTWMANGTKYKYYHASSKTRPPVTVTEDVFKDTSEQNVYQTTRRFYRNKSSLDLQHIVIDLTDQKGEMHGLVFVQYIFKGAEHQVSVQSHGNTMDKSTRYYRTSHASQERISVLCDEIKSPTVAFHEKIDKQGGITQFRNAACHARNVRQVKHIKRATWDHQPNDPHGIISPMTRFWS